MKKKEKFEQFNLIEQSVLETFQIKKMNNQTTKAARGVYKSRPKLIVITTFIN